MPSLIENFRYNFFRGIEDIRIFEASRVFFDSGEALPEEALRLGAILCTPDSKNLWKENIDEFYLLKGVLEALFSEIKVSDIGFRRSKEPFLHPGKSADIFIRGKRIGFIGLLLPSIGDTLDLKKRLNIAVFEIDLDALIEEAPNTISYKEIPKFPYIERDIAIIVDKETPSEEIISLIDRASKSGDSLGGQFLVFATGMPPGLGSHIQWDRRLGGRLSQAIASIQAIKAVEIGSGFRISEMMGSEAMDVIVYEEGRFKRLTNHAGGIEGGMTNGMPITLRAAMKPIPTQRKPLRSVDIITKEPVEAIYERSDVCAVPAASVIAEALVALVLTDTFLEKFGGDSISETKRNYQAYLEYIERF
jgi:hypothetical protein